MFLSIFGYTLISIYVSRPTQINPDPLGRDFTIMHFWKINFPV